MSNLSIIKQKFRSLFNDELLADEGWSAYIDLLLKNLDTSFLQFCRLNGFPHKLNLSDYFTRSEKEGNVAYFSDMFDIEVLNNVVTLTYPNKYKLDDSGNKALKSEDEIEYFDFGNVDVRFDSTKIVKAEVFQDNEWVEVYTYNFQSGKSFGDPYFELSGDSGFRITYKDSEDGIVYYPEFELLYLPESIDPASIVSYKKSNFLVLDKNVPPTSPQALFGVIAQLLGRYKFYVLFRTESGSGSRQKSFSDYVTLYDVTRHEGNEESNVPVHFHAVTASDCPIDALRDSFGVGLQTSKIYGYDKKYLVAQDNTVPDELLALLVDNSPNSDSEIMVSPSELNLPQHVDAERLTAPTLVCTSVTKVTNGPGWVFDFELTTVDSNAESSEMGHYDNDTPTTDVTLSPSKINVAVGLSTARAGQTITFWAKSIAPQGTIYLDSVVVDLQVEIPKEMLAPVLTLSGDIGDVITITASWDEVESAQRYQVFYRKQGDSDWSSLEATTSLTSTFEVSDVGTYEVYVEAQADGFDSVPSDTETITLSEVTLPSPSIRWELGDTFPQTNLHIDSMEHASGFKYRITNGSVTTSWKDAVAGDTLNVGDIVAGVNTIDVYAIGETGYGDSGTTATLVGVKLDAPQIEVSTDLLSMQSTVSWQKVLGASSYAITVDDQQAVTVTELSYQFLVTEGQHTVSVYAKGVNVFDSDSASETFSVGSSDFRLSSENMDFLQRENSAIVGLTATGAYEGDWEVQDSTDLVSRLRSVSVKETEEEEISVPVTGKVLVSTNPAGDFTIDKTEAETPDFTRLVLVAYNDKGELTYVCSPESKRSRTEFGIVKNYSMLSLVSGQLKFVDIYIEALKSNLQSEFGDKFEDFEKALEDILKHAVPAGVGFTINYLYPSLESTLKISDTYIGTSSGIFINGGKEFTLNFAQRTESKNIEIFTIPPTMEWDTKEQE